VLALDEGLRRERITATFPLTAIAVFLIYAFWRTASRPSGSGIFDAVRLFSW